MAVVRSRSRKTGVVTAPGKKPIRFREGGLHRSLGVPQGKPIPQGEFNAALAGRRGPLAKKQAQFKKNVLTGPKRRGRRRS